MLTEAAIPVVGSNIINAATFNFILGFSDSEVQNLNENGA